MSNQKTDDLVRQAIERIGKIPYAITQQDAVDLCEIRDEVITMLQAALPRIEKEVEVVEATKADCATHVRAGVIGLCNCVRCEAVQALQEVE